MSMKSKLAELEIKDPKLKSFLSDMADSIDLVRDNILISDQESKVMGFGPNDNICRILPSKLILDSIQFTGDLNRLVLDSSKSMWAQVRTNTTTSIQDITFQTLDWAVESYDTDDMFDAGTPTRFTIKHDGIYLVTATITFAAAGAGTTRILGLRRFISNGRCFARASSAPQGGSGVSLVATGKQRLSKGNYVEAFCYQDSGAPLLLDTTFSANAAYSFFQIARVA